MNTETIALIGCITGIASLIISFYKVLGERMRLKIIYNQKTSLWFDKLELYKSCNTKYQGLIDIHIINKSANPITIFKLDLYLGKEKLTTRKFEYDSFKLLETVKDEWHYTEIEFNMASKFDTPLKLEPYCAFHGQIFLPFLPDDISETAKIIAIFKTTKRTKIKFFKLKHFRKQIYYKDKGTYEYE